MGVTLNPAWSYGARLMVLGSVLEVTMWAVFWPVHAAPSQTMQKYASRQSDRANFSSKSVELNGLHSFLGLNLLVTAANRNQYQPPHKTAIIRIFRTKKIRGIGSTMHLQLILVISSVCLVGAAPLQTRQSSDSDDYLNTPSSSATSTESIIHGTTTEAPFELEFYDSSQELEKSIAPIFDTPLDRLSLIHI